MLKFLFNSIKCPHNKVLPNADGDFCPDCGEEVKVSWQILRCDCCSTKRTAHTFINKIVPDEKFCKKCGSLEYYVEIKEKIEFFDYEYAILLKEEVKAKSRINKTLQIWIEEENFSDIFVKPKLLPVF